MHCGQIPQSGELVVDECTFNDRILFVGERFELLKMVKSPHSTIC
jgi:hypothetical protein